MQSSQPALARGPQIFRLLVSSAMLLLYLVTATPLAAASTALLATADRNHHVVIQQTASGWELVLRHDAFHSPMHRHGIVARALTVFARQTTPKQPDHVIPFGATDTVQRPVASAVEPAPRAQSSDAFPVGDRLFPADILTASLAAIPRPPPTAAGGRLLGLRSTILLI